MNPQQRRTAIGLLILGLGGLLLLLLALYIELAAVHAGGHSTISELVWLVWAKEPWVVLIGSHCVAAPSWYLAGHFTAQSSEVYDRIRTQGLS